MMNRAFPALLLCLLSSTALAGPLGAMTEVNCEYAGPDGSVKKPVVHTRNEMGITNGREDDFDKVLKMTVSVAYVITGKKASESATVVSWQTSGSADDFVSAVDAVGNKTGAKIQIRFNGYGGPSRIRVNGVEQSHMTGLRCRLSLKS